MNNVYISDSSVSVCACMRAYGSEDKFCLAFLRHHPLFLTFNFEAESLSGRQDSEAQFRGRTLEVRVSSCSPGLFWNLLCRTGWPPTQRSTCLCLLSAGIESTHPHTLWQFVERT